MKSLLAFIKKEFLGQLREGKLFILTALFLLFGVMNPLVAKLTPWLLEIMADSLAESGMQVTNVTVTAMDSWVQFFKNIPIALIAFTLIEGSIFTKEYSSGTLILALTKGFKRFKVVLSKIITLITVWSVGYFVCFLVTYGYNAYFWDNQVANNLIFSVLSWWVFGIFVVSLITIFSTIFTSNSGVLLSTGGVVFASYLLGVIPKINKFLPTFLTDGNSLIYGVLGASKYVIALIITIVLTLICFISSVIIFNKKQL